MLKGILPNPCCDCDLTNKIEPSCDLWGSGVEKSEASHQRKQNTQEANGACFSGTTFAAQKYGPPLVGWALQTSRKTSIQVAKNIPLKEAHLPLTDQPSW